MVIGSAKRDSSLRYPHGFTLLEVLAVLAIMSVGLLITASMLGGGGGVQSRQAAREQVRGVLVRARAEALTSGSYVAVAMPGYDDGPENMRGRAMGIFEVQRDEPTGTYDEVKQLHRWFTLPKGVVLRKGQAVKEGARNVFLEGAGVLQVGIPEEGSNEKRGTEVSAIIFNPQGGVEYPGGSGELELQFGLGAVQAGRLVASKGSMEDAHLHEVLLVSRLTGRARTLPQVK